MQDETIVVQPEKSVEKKNIDAGKFILKTFLYLALGLFISAVVAVLASLLFDYIFQTVGESTGYTIFLITLLVSIVGILICSIIVGRTTAKGKGKAIIPYVIYTILFGIMLSTFTLFIDFYYLGMVFGITAVLFLLMGLIGSWTKGKAWGVVLSVCLCLALGVSLFYVITAYMMIPMAADSGADLTSIYYIFLICECVFLLVMLVYTAFDIFRLKKQAEAGLISDNNAVLNALILYSDFWRIFIYVLRILIIAAAKKK